MVDPNDITRYNLSHRELEFYLTFWVCVAGKTAKTISAALERFWTDLGCKPSPFKTLQQLSQKQIAAKLKKHGIGCYNQKAKTLYLLAHSNFNLRTCTVEDLESISGIGKKTSRCFIMHSRKEANCAGLDVHLLHFLRDLGLQNIPNSTPGSSRKYKEIEAEFLKLCQLVNKPPAKLDLLVWRVYSQHTHLKKRLILFFKDKGDKMNEQLYLACQIQEETSSDRLVISKLMDGTSFNARVPYWNVIPVKDSPVKSAWLLVEVLGKDEKNGKTMVKLPSPALNLGHNVCVSAKDMKTVAEIQGQTKE